MKFIFALLFTLVMSFSFITKSGIKAHNKYFWGDEATDIFSTMTESPKDILFANIKNQQSGSPLYFLVQQYVLKTVLNKEKTEAYGFDWKVSFRIVPILSVCLGLIVWTLLLYKDSLFLALVVPAVVSTFGETIWYAAETRIYGTWLMAALIYFAALVRFALRKDFLSSLFWLVGAVLCISVAVSSILFIFLSSGALLLTFLLFDRKKLGFEKYRLLGTILIVNALVFALYKYWTIAGRTNVSLSNFKETPEFYFKHFTTIGLIMFGGLKGFLFILFSSLFFILFGIKSKSKGSKVYFLLGALGLSQIISMAGVYFGQISTGYFFSDRHAIFVLVTRGLIFTAVCLFLHSFLSKFLKLNIPAKKILWAALFAVAVFDWFNWNVKEALANMRGLTQTYQPYCHQPVIVSDQPSPDPITDRDLATVLNVTTQKRHAGDCLISTSADSTKFIYDFNPNWIYK